MNQATSTAIAPHSQINTPTSEQPVAIVVENVGKQYRIYDNPQDRLKQMLLARFGHEFGREFWALRNVSLTVCRGEMTGIIGRNGSGKSTLLQIIAGTLAPSHGSVQVNGRVAALLELGSGFNPEFTGRENVFLNGSILGISREEMEQRYSDIVTFADIGEFIDQPVKTYSSGMIVRLAFAVQACVEPDILIVDEALAVGDIFFQQKCYRRLEVLREHGTSILLVTHNLGDVKQYCKQAILLNQGEIAFAGSSADCVAQYLMLDQNNSRTEQQSTTPVSSGYYDNDVEVDSSFFWPAPAAFYSLDHVTPVSNGDARCIGVALCDVSGQPCRAFHQGDTASFFYEFEVLRDIEVAVGGMEIFNEKGIHVHGKNTLQYTGLPNVAAQRGSRLRFRHNVTLDIAWGEYTFEVGIAAMSQADYRQRDRLTTEDLYERITRLCHIHGIGTFLVLRRKLRQPVNVLHWGIANLPGDAAYTVILPRSKDRS